MQVKAILSKKINFVVVLSTAMLLGCQAHDQSEEDAAAANADRAAQAAQAATDAASVAVPNAESPASVVASSTVKYPPPPTDLKTTASKVSS